jgi:hypothetical protein
MSGPEQNRNGDGTKVEWLFLGAKVGADRLTVGRSVAEADGAAVRSRFDVFLSVFALLLRHR